VTDPGPFLTAHWRHLAMLNYEVDAAVLRGRVPAGTELDTFEGRTLVSMVGFRFLRTRVLGVPVPFHRNFDEVNLRFYVRREATDGVRRGVVFVKEIVPRAAIAWIARRVYNENYVALPMSHVDEIGRSAEPRVEYAWQHAGRREHLAARVGGAPSLPPLGSEASFITEHYWGFARQRDGGTVEYRVEHPRWRVWRATDSEFECDVTALYGSEFAPFLRGPPASAFVAEGSDVTVLRGVRMTDPG
jgi:uncharacterized protein YqjF (DUF2071 family)